MGIFKRSNSTTFIFSSLLNNGQPLKERICTHRSKFFPLRKGPFGRVLLHRKADRKSQVDLSVHHKVWSCVVEKRNETEMPFRANSVGSSQTVPSQTMPRSYKTFSYSTQLSMKFLLLINVEMSTIVGISTSMSRKNSILGLSEPAKYFIS